MKQGDSKFILLISYLLIKVPYFKCCRYTPWNDPYTPYDKVHGLQFNTLNSLLAY